MQSSLRRSALLVCSALALFSCSGGGGSGGGGAVTQKTAQYDAGVAVQWFELLCTAIRTESLNPPYAARRLGYAGVTLYESCVGGMPDHQTLAGQLNGLDSMPARPAGVLSWPLVANSAMATISENLFATASAPTLAAIAALETTLQGQLEVTVSAAVATRSIDYGEQIGQAVFAWSQTDGFTQWNNCAYTPPTGPGLWVPTPPAFTPNPLQPCWGNLRPFALLYAAECSPLPHPPYSTAVGSQFYVEALEVRDTVDNLTVEQLAIAQFWADGAGTLTPPAHWASILCQVCGTENLTLDIAAEGFARVGVAVADAFISCWELKYHYNLLRPISYIQDPAGPINDPTWLTAPGVGTPPFPEYTSGHSVQSGAAASILQDLLGAFPFTDDTHAGTWPARSFDSFLEAANEAAASRLYAGIHYRAACERGVEQGQCIAQVILDNVHFRK